MGPYGSDVVSRTAKSLIASGGAGPGATRLLLGMFLAVIASVYNQSASAAGGSGDERPDTSRSLERAADKVVTYASNSKTLPPGQEPESKCKSESAGRDASQQSASRNEVHGDSPESSLKQFALWKQAEITLTIDGSFPKAPHAIAAVQAALHTWATTASELPRVNLRLADDHVIEGADEVSRAEHRLYFAPSGDERTKGALAVTVTAVDVEHARILDGDIIIDGSYQYPDLELAGRADGVLPAYDLQSVLTHELGHWFGLPEDYCNPDATMYAYTYPGETLKRDLAQPDIVTAQVAYWQLDNPSGEVGCHVAKPAADSRFGLLSYGAALALCMRGRRPNNAKPRNGRGNELVGSRRMDRAVRSMKRSQIK